MEAVIVGLRYYSGICVEGLTKQRKTAGIVIVPFGIQIGLPPNTSQKCYSFF
jgi:hypothetical protein